MTEVNSSSTPEYVVSPAQQAAPVPATPTRGAPALQWLLAALAVLGTGLLGVVFLQQRQAMATLAGDAYTLQQRGAAIEQQLAAAAAERASLVQQLQQQQALLDESRDSAPQAEVTALRRELDALRLDVVSQVANSEHDWLLVEATTLLRLAQQQALHGRNVASAISLYASAAARLQRITDPALQPARAALQLELDALRAVQVPEVESLYLQLGELVQQLDALQVQSDDEVPLQFVAPAAGALPTTASWWDELKQSLSQYFVVARRDVPVLARLTPEQAVLIRQAIVLQLETARLALLQGQTRLYQSALDAAMLGITQQLQGEAKPALLASLQRLREAAIVAVIPPLGSALQALELVAANAPQNSGAPTP